MEQKRTVLVVDDENVVCRSFDRVLTENGYRVNTVLNGADALNKVKQTGFDIVFVDLKMPGINGMEVVRSIRHDYPQIQVIIVTGYNTPEAMAEATRLGVTECVSKPLSPERISNLAHQAIIRKNRFLDLETPVEPIKDPDEAISSKPLAVEPIEAPQQELTQRPSVVKTLSILVIGPLMGMAYVMFLPLIGFGMCFWLCGKKLSGWARGRKELS